MYICENITRVNRFLAVGGKMKLNDSKSSVLNFLLSMKRKLVLCLSLASPLSVFGCGFLLETMLKCEPQS